MNNILDLVNSDISKRFEKRAYEKGATLFKEEENCIKIGIVISGKVKISSFTEDGNEVIFNEIKKNEIFGMNLIFSTKPFYKGDVVAVETTTITYISFVQLLDLLKTNEAFLLEYLSLSSNFTKALNDKIKLLSFDDPKERLFFFLSTHGGHYSFRSVTDLSELLNIRRETLSRLLSKLVKENRITIKEKEIIRLF